VVAYMSKTYSDWLGRQVVLQIETGESLVPLRGLVVNESNNVLRFRGREVDIYTMVKGVVIPIRRHGGSSEILKFQCNHRIFAHSTFAAVKMVSFSSTGMRTPAEITKIGVPVVQH
jgi:RNase P/RNase MRP subunit p29